MPLSRESRRRIPRELPVGLKGNASAREGGWWRGACIPDCPKERHAHGRPCMAGRGLGPGFDAPGLFCSCPRSRSALLEHTYGVPRAPPLAARFRARRGPAYLGLVVKVAPQTARLGPGLTVVPPLENARGCCCSGENSFWNAHRRLPSAISLPQSGPP